MHISFKNVDHTYMRGSPFEKQALSNVDLTLKSGSFTAVCGSTGSGKSTLTQHINGLLLPTSGEVTVGDVVLQSKTKRKIVKKLRRSIGMVFQYPEHQLFGATVEEDILFGPMHLGLDLPGLRRRLPDLLNLVGLPATLASVSPFSLSGGQMRRVAIAGVLAADPQVLILDEPAAGLDPAGHRALLDMLRGWHEEHGLTTVLVTHDMEDAARYADEVVVIHGGTPLMTGKPLDVFEQTDRLADIGLTSPPSVRIGLALRATGLQVDDLLAPPHEMAQSVAVQLNQPGEKG